MKEGEIGSFLEAKKEKTKLGCERSKNWWQKNIEWKKLLKYIFKKNVLPMKTKTVNYTSQIFSDRFVNGKSSRRFLLLNRQLNSIVEIRLL